MRQWRKIYYGRIHRKKKHDLFSVHALLYGDSMPSLWLGVSSILHALDAINRWLVAREDAVCVLT